MFDFVPAQRQSFPMFSNAMPNPASGDLHVPERPLSQTGGRGLSYVIATRWHRACAGQKRTSFA